MACVLSETVTILYKKPYFIHKNGAFFNVVSRLPMPNLPASQYDDHVIEATWSGYGAEKFAVLTQHTLHNLWSPRTTKKAMKKMAGAYGSNAAKAGVVYEAWGRVEFAVKTKTCWIHASIHSNCRPPASLYSTKATLSWAYWGQPPCS